MRPTRSTLVSICALLVSACASPTPIERPTRLDLSPTPFAKEVRSDGPLAHWRLNGTAKGAIADDPDRAMGFQKGQARILQGADFGGPEWSVEMWLKAPQGTALTYRATTGSPSLKIVAGNTLAVEVMGERVDTGLTLSPDAWSLLGIAGRSEDGLLMVTVGGLLKWRGHAAKDKPLPYDGTLVAGGQFEGELDEIAVFDSLKFASHWLRRRGVAEGWSKATDTNQTPRIVIQQGHGAGIIAMSWSPDGALIASTGEDGTVKLWDAASGALIRNLSDHTAVIITLAWSPDGTMLASAGEDSVVKLWDVASGAVLHSLEGHTEDVNTLSWSCDGRLLVSAGEDETVKIWDARNGALLHDFKDHAEGLITTAWAPEDHRVAAAFKDGLVRVWDLQNGARFQDFKGHTDRIYTLDWSPNSTRIATGDDEGHIKLWDVDKGAFLMDLEGHDDAIRGLRWSPDGARIASAGSDRTLKLWDADGGNLEHSLEGHQDTIMGLSWSPDSARVATASEDGTVKAWSVGSGTLEHTWEGHGQEVMAVGWSPDGSRVASAGMDKTVRIWDARTHDAVHTLTGNTHPVTHAAWHPSGDKVATADTHGSVRVWDARGGTLLHHLKGHEKDVFNLAWDPAGERLASVDRTGAMLIWDADKGTVLRTLNAKSWNNTLLWSPDGASLLSTSSGSPSTVWDVDSGEPRRVLGDAKDRQIMAAWSPDGARIVTASRDTLDIWDARSGKRLRTIKGLRRGVEAVLWSPDGARIMAVRRGLMVKVWDARSGTLQHTLEGHEDTIMTAAWSPDGARLATASEDGVAKVWDVNTGALIHDLKGHTAAIPALGWSPDGDRLATASWDRGLKIWDAETGALRRALDGHAGGVLDLDWTRDGGRIATAGADNTLRVWDLEIGTAVAFLGAENGHWAAITDEGYFSGSDGAGDELVMAQGARVFAIDQLAPARNRPEKILAQLGAPRDQIDFYGALWSRRLDRLGLDAAAVSATFEAAPKARLLGLEGPDQNGEVRLRVLLTDAVGLRGYQIHVNGVPIDPALTLVSGTRQRLVRTVQLTKGANTVEISALNTQGVESLRASTTLDHDGRGLPSPRLFFLGFGVSDYRDDRIDLGFAHQDAIDLAGALSTNEGAFSEVLTRTFTNAEVTEAALDKARDFLAPITAHDTLVMFIAGHGVRDQDTTRTYYYLDHDTDIGDLAGTAIPFKDLEALLYNARARKKLFLMDTCQSGEDIDLDAVTAPVEGVRGLKARAVRSAVVFTGASTPKRDPEQWLAALRDRNRLILQDLTRRSGAIVLASSLGRESSLEAPEWRNGAFTEVILSALQTGAADTNGDGFADTDELARHVIKAVPELTGGRQHPNVERDNPFQRFALPIAP